jgi:DNA polymerase elongation subunit (family B)
MHSLHNTKLYVNESNYIDKLSKAIISRSNYLNIQDINITHNKIKNKKKILILPNDISESLIFEKYKLIFHGILPCGTKVTLIINKIYPYVDIDYNENISEEENINHIKSLFKNERLLKMLKGKIPDYKNIELKHGKKFMYFNEKESKFIRIYFNKLYHRICFIRLLVKLNIPSYNNDLNNYYRVVSRSFKIFLSSWNVINNYTIERNSKYKSEYVLSADINDIKPYTDNMYDKYFSDVNIDLIRKDKCISMAFDIEQYSSNFDPLRPDIVIMPSGKIKEDEIFNIGFTYQFINEKDSFLNITLLTKEANEHEDYFTIMCSNEKVLLNVFSYINSILQPDYIMEFNGSEFDWISIYDKCIYYKNIELFCENFSIKKLSNYDLKLENIDKYIYSTDSVKLSADIPHKTTRNIKLEGYIPFDVRVIFMQLNPTHSKSSLKYYLDLNNLPNKDDMPIPELFRFYRENDIPGMTEVAHYCYIDAFRLHQLVLKNNIIQDRREISKISYTSIFDAFYRANACKVTNLIISEALDRNLFVNNIKKEESEEEKTESKYPGALVLNPKKGLISNVLTIQEFCKDRLNIKDMNLINNLQEIINNNYEAIYIEKKIDLVKF